MFADVVKLDSKPSQGQAPDDGGAEAVACRDCGRVYAVGRVPPGSVATCERCGAVLTRRIPNSLARTEAFSLAALLLYAPANLLPILIMEVHGRSSTNTVWQSVRGLYDDKDYAVATIVLLASIVVPLLKLSALFMLTVTTRLRMRRWRKARTVVHRVIRAVGKWAMLDVFALAILVSLVKLEGMARVLPGQGLFAFGAVVIFTLLASESFDPRALWEPEDDRA